MSGYRNLSNTFLQRRKRQMAAEDSVARSFREFQEKVKHRPDKDLLVPPFVLWKNTLTKKQRAYYYYPDGTSRPRDKDGFPLPFTSEERAAQQKPLRSAKAAARNVRSLR